MKLKPETIARLQQEQRQQQEERKADTIARLSEKVTKYGEDSIYAEMLRELQNT